MPKTNFQLNRRERWAWIEWGGYGVLCSLVFIVRYLMVSGQSRGTPQASMAAWLSYMIAVWASGLLAGGLLMVVAIGFQQRHLGEIGFRFRTKLILISFSRFMAFVMAMVLFELL